VDSLSQDTKPGIDKMLLDQPGVVLESVARTFNVPLASVVARLPAAEQVTAPGELFVAIMEEVSNWRGYYNIPGAIGGHFKPEEFHSISFIDRTLMGKPSRSILFFNSQGSCVFKLYLGRQENREMIPEQVQLFGQLIEKIGDNKASR